MVAARGADFVFRQILVHGLFHADPHPGNILVLPDNVVAFIDFGIVGRVNRRLRHHLAQVILAIGARDAERVAGIVLEVGLIGFLTAGFLGIGLAIGSLRSGRL